MRSSHRLAIAGFVCALPALLAVCSGLLRFSVPLLLISPFVVLPGLIAAFVVSIAAVLRVEGVRRAHDSVAALRVTVEARALNLAVAALSVLLATILAGYLFVENFRS